MRKINLLSSKIYNRISAGEVIERPCSVVKELVENSIDAGAKNIEISITDGGISSIVIADDGCGINYVELPMALMPHATSKISKIKDLDKIETLGFRGEALASITSVSKITLESKPEKQATGGRIYGEGGNVTELSECGCPNGTCVTVKNLFFNTPVRERFLKSEKIEEGEITSLVSKLILGNPNIAFKYSADGKMIYQSFGDGFESAMVKIFGAGPVKDFFHINTYKNGITIDGYLSKTYFTKGNRTHQTVFLNGRYIANQTIFAAINNAYASYLMKHRYAVYVLNINIPTEAIDVNVHPNKMDVRFSNSQVIYSTLNSVVSKVLDGSSEALKIVTPDKLSEPIDKSKDYDKFFKPVHDPKEPYVCPPVKPWTITFSDPGKVTITDYKVDPEHPENDIVDVFDENKAYIMEMERELRDKTNPQDVKKPEQLSFVNERKLKFIGQVLNTYIVLEDGKDLFLIDQHAAHERLLFDKYCETVKEKNVILQSLLVPYILNVNNEELNFIREKKLFLMRAGFVFDEFGLNCLKIREIPNFLTGINLDEFFKDLFSDLNTLKEISVLDLMVEKISLHACKSAIKSGDNLSDNEIFVLLQKLNGNLGLKCPHGRPIAIKISRTEIDKWFKRIV